VDGKRWYIHRKVSARLFNVKNFKTHIMDTFNSNLDFMLHQILQPASEKNNNIEDDSGQIVDMHKIFYAYTLDSIGQIAFGENIGSLTGKDVQFAKAFDECQFQVLFNVSSYMFSLKFNKKN